MADQLLDQPCACGAGGVAVHIPRASWILAVLCSFEAFLVAGDVRPNELEAARKSRPPQIELDEAPAVERALMNGSIGQAYFKPFAHGYGGLRVKSGGLIPGSGFAIGPEYVRRDLALGHVMVRASARRSLRGYSLYDAEFALPRLYGDRAFFDILAGRQDFTKINYFGQGPDTSESNRTSFRLRANSYESTAGIRPLSRLRVGGTAGYLQATVGPGRRGEVPPTVTLERRTDFVTTGAFVEFDYTDVPGSPRAGGDYSVKFTNYLDQELGSSSHRRVDLRVQQYIPFFNHQRVIALRGHSVFTDAAAGRSVPFYLQPTLGGPETLRGFDVFRFYDNNLLLLSAEYRWKVLSGAELALFIDSGEVFGSRTDFRLRDLERSYGIGLRVNSRQNIFARLDFACGREGCQLWIRFNNAF